MVLAQYIQEIQTLILSFHPLLVIETVEEERVQAILQQATEDMNLALYEWTIVQGLVQPRSTTSRWSNEYAPPNSDRPPAADNTQEPSDLLQHIEQMNSSGIFWLKDFGRHLDEPKVIRQLRDLIDGFVHNRSAIILTGDSLDIPPEIAHHAVYIDLKLPDLDELNQATKDTLRVLKMRHRKQIDLPEDDMKNLVRSLSGMTLQQARQVLAYAAFEDGKLNASDVQLILKRKAQVIREESVLEYFPASSVKTELGGFSGLKNWLSHARVGYSPKAKALNLQGPKGILIVGIQGCGKSLAAKAIARAWRIPLLKLEAGRLFDKYVGESEKNFRQAVTLAESMAPAVLWIDEIEKGFSNSGSEGDGGLSQRMFGFFLTWMQEKSEEVFVVATANDISKIPPELLRKGRFDEIFFVDLPNAEQRLSILKIHLRQHKQSGDALDLDALVNATAGFSGAELEQVVITTLYHSLYRKKAPDTDLYLQQAKAIIPLSVSRREDIQLLRDLAKERFVSAQ